MAKPMRFKEDLSVLQWLKLCFSEFLGTAFLVFLGCAGSVHGLYPAEIALRQIGFCFGFAIMISITCFVFISGAHINPILTLAAAILGHKTWMHFLIYTVAQIVGALFGQLCVVAITPWSKVSGNWSGEDRVQPATCMPHKGKEVHVLGALGAEFIGCFILIQICCAVWDPRNAHLHDSVPIKFGLAVAGIVYAIAPFSSSNLNPARSLAPALVHLDFTDHWVWWIGPFAGSAVCALIYRYVFDETPGDDD